MSEQDEINKKVIIKLTNQLTRRLEEGYLTLEEYDEKVAQLSDPDVVAKKVAEENYYSNWKKSRDTRNAAENEREEENRTSANQGRE